MLEGRILHVYQKSGRVFNGNTDAKAPSGINTTLMHGKLWRSNQSLIPLCVVHALTLFKAGWGLRLGLAKPTQMKPCSVMYFLRRNPYSVVLTFVRGRHTNRWWLPLVRASLNDHAPADHGRQLNCSPPPQNTSCPAHTALLPNIQKTRITAPPRTPAPPATVPR